MENKARFRRASRLRRRADFLRVQKEGTNRRAKHFILLTTGDNQERTPRLGITASKKVGNAVARNRVKRQIREWFRRTPKELLGPTDRVVIARKGAIGLPAKEVAKELRSLIK